MNASIIGISSSESAEPVKFLCSDLQCWLDQRLAANENLLLQTLTSHHREIIKQLAIVQESSSRICQERKADEEEEEDAPPAAVIERVNAPTEDPGDISTLQAKSLDSSAPILSSSPQDAIRQKSIWQSIHEATISFAHGKYFELFVVVAILCNLLFIACERQYHGIISGCEIGYYGHNDCWIARSGSGFQHFFDWGTVFFSAGFVCEACLRVYAIFHERPGMFSADVCWIAFDLLVISLDIVALVGRSLNVQVMKPSLFRMVRLARLPLIIKGFKEFHVFDSLFLLIRSIQASLHSLVWSFALLLILQMAMAIILNNILQGFMEDDTKSLTARQQVFEYFGTFSRAVVTMFEISTGNWVTSCRFLVENVSEWFQLFYLLYRCMICFAVVRVISAVFIAETNRMIMNDEELEVRKDRKVASKHRAQLKNLFMHLGQGNYLTKERLVSALKDENIKARLHSLGIAGDDLDALFDILDDMDEDNGEGVVEQDDFIKGIAHVRGPARSLDVKYLRKQMNDMTQCLGQLKSAVQFLAQNRRISTSNDGHHHAGLAKLYNRIHML